MHYQTIANKLKNYKIGRGLWNLEQEVEKLEQIYTHAAVVPDQEQVSFIPQKDPSFVPFGNFSDLKKVIQSKRFYPVFITGMSGNGATVWHNGPVIEALERGAILLLDEVDLASNKILCLQSVLEGKGIFLKKIGKYVRPANGFSVVATANTKGKGSDDGRFIGTNVLNEAFLERFPITFEQEYPTEKTEVKIVSAAMDDKDPDFAEKLVRWAQVIRKTFYDGGVDEIISTRRLVHIAQAYKIFGKRDKAIEVCVNRFDTDTKQSFLELYSKIDANVNPDDDDNESPEEMVRRHARESYQG